MLVTGAKVSMRSRALPFLLIILLRIGLGNARVRSIESVEPLDNISFTGHVVDQRAYAGVPGVEVRLWLQAGEYYPAWTLVDTKVTDQSGRFRLRIYVPWRAELPMPTAWNFRIEKSNPPGYSSIRSQPGPCANACAANGALGPDTIWYELWEYWGDNSNMVFFVSAAPPEILGIEPIDDSGPAGYTQVFEARVRDDGTAWAIGEVTLKIGQTCGSPHANSVRLSLSPWANRVCLLSDDGLEAVCAELPGEGKAGVGMLQNSQGAIKLGRTLYARQGNELMFKTGIRFKARYAGEHIICVGASDLGGASALQEVGSWLVEPIPTRTATASPTATETLTTTATRAWTATATMTTTPTVTATETRPPPIHLPLITRT